MAFWMGVLQGFIGNVCFYGMILLISAISLGIFAERWDATYIEDAHTRNEKIRILVLLNFFIGSIRVWIEEEDSYFRYVTLGVRRRGSNTGYYFGINNSETGAFMMFASDRAKKYSGQYLLADSSHKSSTSVAYEWTHD